MNSSCDLHPRRVTEISAPADGMGKGISPKTAALVAKHGGKPLIGGNSTPRLLPLEGVQPPLGVVILRFLPSSRFKKWHDDPDYEALKQLRQANVDIEVFVVESA